MEDFGRTSRAKRVVSTIWCYGTSKGKSESESVILLCTELAATRGERLTGPFPEKPRQRAPQQGLDLNPETLGIQGRPVAGSLAHSTKAQVQAVFIPSVGSLTNHLIPVCHPLDQWKPLDSNLFSQPWTLPAMRSSIKASPSQPIPQAEQRHSAATAAFLFACLNAGRKFKPSNIVAPSRLH